MKTVFANSWWSLVLRGIAAILMAIVTFLSPGITLLALVLLFGAYALIDGILNIAGAWRAAEANEKWVAFLIEGIAGIIAAAATIFWPAITVVALVYIIAAWSLITGMLEIAAAIRLRKYITGEWLLALMGVISILFGVALMAFPITGALALTIWIGVYALLIGGLLIGLGIRLRTLARSSDFGPPMSVPSH
jgi:uncharacterized membrane protein HdeD (DUF308 family)